MENQKRAQWSSKSAFILAAISSAVGLGNACRFPSLVLKNGGGTFVMVYLLLLFLIGIPLLMMEIAIGRKFKKGAPSAFKEMGKKTEYVGWTSVINSFFISTYYAVIFAWIILMCVLSFKFASINDTTVASQLFYNAIGSNKGLQSTSTILIFALISAWVIIYWCIRNSVNSVSKIAKYTVIIPIAILVIMALKGIFSPNSIEGIKLLFIPDFSKIFNAQLWIDALGQVLFSLSIMMCLMIAYGSYLDEKTNIASSTVIIAITDFSVSMLATLVMFTTLNSTKGIYNPTLTMLQEIINDLALPASERIYSLSTFGTAFSVYPQAIISITNYGWINAIFGFIFYFCLATLAIGSVFSIIEGIGTAINDKFKLKSKNTTIILCVVIGFFGLFYITGIGEKLIDIVDTWSNQFNMILIGLIECITVGWLFKTPTIIEEINKNTTKFKMSKIWFNPTIKYIAPILFGFLFVFNILSGTFPTNSALGVVLGIIIIVSTFFGYFLIQEIQKKLETKKSTIIFTNVSTINKVESKINTADIGNKDIEN